MRALSLVGLLAVGACSHSLESVADRGTTLNPQIAPMARKVAEAVVDDRYREGVTHYRESFPSESDSLRTVNAVFLIRDEEYSVAVGSSKNGGEDYLGIVISRPGSQLENLPSIAGFDDSGIDGSCDFGSDSSGVYDRNSSFGLENRQRLQRAYEQALGEIAKFYKVK